MSENSTGTETEGRTGFSSVTVAEAAELMKCSTATVRRRIADGELAAFSVSGRSAARRSYRVRIDSLEAFTAGNETVTAEI